RHPPPPHPFPTRPSSDLELQYHRTLAMHKHRHGSGYAWPLDDGNGLQRFPINPILVANDPAALKGALLCGEGLVIGADVMVKPRSEEHTSELQSRENLVC